VEIGLTHGERELREHLHDRFFAHSEYDFQVTTKDGHLLFASARLAEPESPITLPGTSKGGSAESMSVRGLGDLRVARRVYPGPNGDVTVQACTSLDPLTTQMRSLATTLATVGLFTIAIGLAGGYLLARKALAPVGQMARTAQRITGARLDERLVVANANDELGRLASTVNTMIDRLRDAIEDTRRFTADAAHELRTPLAVIQTEAEVALRGAHTPEEFRKAIQVTLNESRRLGRLADQLLILCRQDAGLLAPSWEEVQLDALVADVVEQLRSLAQDRGIRLVQPTMSEPCMVRGDDIQLSRVFYNVLENAIKYAPANSEVSVSVTHAGDQVTVTVKDLGPGIPEANIPRVFDRFYRADASRSRNGLPGGAGLGLAISKAIVDAHHGSITLENLTDGGTKVVIVLPSIPTCSDLSPSDMQLLQPKV
jgi:heavy metal sensor kinase